MKSAALMFVMVLTVAAQPSQQQPIVRGLPYSADEVQERVSSLDSQQSEPSNHLIGRVFRDSQGRTRKESALIHSPVWRVEIHDPTAGVVYTSDESGKVWYRTQITAPVSSTSAVATSMGLGTQNIAGFEARG